MLSRGRRTSSLAHERARSRSDQAIEFRPAFGGIWHQILPISRRKVELWRTRQHQPGTVAHDLEPWVRYLTSVRPLQHRLEIRGVRGVHRPLMPTPCRGKYRQQIRVRGRVLLDPAEA